MYINNPLMFFMLGFWRVRLLVNNKNYKLNYKVFKKIHTVLRLKYFSQYKFCSSNYNT